MPEEFQRRLPSVRRKVSEIKPEDIRVSLLGTIVDRKDELVVLDDGSGRITANFDDSVGFEINSLVRVFGRVMPIENGFELRGEIIQDMSGLDLGLWKKVEKL